MTRAASRVVLITGASSGIGRATAELLAARGCQVFGGVRAPAATRPLAGVELVPLDVRDEVSIKACVEKVRNRAGRIDVLINNAGVNLVGAVEETSISQAQALFDTNVIGVLRMMQAVLPAMRHEGAGQIINISSILGFLPAPFMGVYAGTKHAVEGLSESLDHEVRAFGIRVVLIEPPYIRTNLDASAAQAEGRIEAYAPQRHRTAALITAIALSAGVLFGVGVYSSVTLVGDWRKNGLKMVAIGLGAAAAGFLIGRLFHTAGA